jgi:Glycosyltransferase family 87
VALRPRRRLRPAGLRGLARATALAVLAATLTLPGSASARTSPAPGSTPEPASSGPVEQTADQFEPGIDKAEAIRIARTDPKVAEVRRAYGALTASAEGKPGSWQVDFYAEGTDRLQVIVDDAGGAIRESWTGDQIAWQMARGYSGQFGHKLNAPYVWLPLAAIFLFGLLDFRRLRRAAHLDLLVLLSFGISEAYFNAADIGASVPLAYPPLLYLLGRMAWLGFRGPGRGLRPSAPIAWLAVGGAFLLGFRIALNVADSGVIDVGYAGVIGADHLTHGEAIWGSFPSDNQFGDTYGPFNYYAYAPFELVLPWSGSWDDLPAAHAAAIFFDLATVAGLFMLGRRLRPGADGTGLGVILGFAWAAYPFTDYALQSNSNDALLAALLVWSLVLFAAPLWRGVLLALAVGAKFAPLPLLPLYAGGQTGFGARAGGSRWSRLRPLAAFAAAFAGVIGVVLALPAIDPGLATFYDRTINSQIDRTSPFSIWGQDHSLEWLQTAVKVFAVALAIVVAFVPRRRSLPQVAALAAAVVIAVELAAEHWFYLYIPWFCGLALPAIAFSTSRSSSPTASLSSAANGPGRSLAKEAASER